MYYTENKLAFTALHHSNQHHFRHFAEIKQLIKFPNSVLWEET